MLRVVSSGSWGSNRTNFLETFDARDVQQLRPIDQVAFGDQEKLRATIFLGNRAFFVTHEDRCPFHAFYIEDQGACTEMSEFVAYVKEELKRTNQDGWQERVQQALVKLPPTHIVRARPEEPE